MHAYSIPPNCRVATLIVAALLLLHGTEAATILVPQDHTTIQAAIDAAAPNDIIEITNSQTYIEDLTVATPVTIRGAAGQRPTIQAKNEAPRYEPLGITGPDNLGALMRAPGIVLENLTFDNPNDAPDAQNVSAALTIVASNCTIRNCRITSIPTSGYDSIGVGVLDLDVPFGGATPSGVLFDSCQIETNKYGMAISWFVAPDVAPQVTVRNSTFRAGSSAGMTSDSGNVTVENCLFEANTGNALNVGGGQVEVSNSRFTQNLDEPAIILTLDGRSADAGVPPGRLIMHNSRVYQNGRESVPAVHVHEGTLTANHCIFSDNGSNHIRMDDSGSLDAPAQVYLDHCDFYKSFNSDEIYIEGSATGQTIAFEINNSIVTEGDGGFYVIFSDLKYLDPNPQLATYSAFYEFDIPFLEIPAENCILFESGEPPYNSTDASLPDSFTLPPGNPLLTAGTGGTYLGSVGLPVTESEFTTPTLTNEGKVHLSWTGSGTLQEQTAIGGNWDDSVNQANPQDVDPSGSQKFYRIRN